MTIGRLVTMGKGDHRKIGDNGERGKIGNCGEKYNQREKDSGII